jgi:hypothetical protein
VEGGGVGTSLMVQEGQMSDTHALCARMMRSTVLSRHALQNLSRRESWLQNHPLQLDASLRLTRRQSPACEPVAAALRQQRRCKTKRDWGGGSVRMSKFEPLVL